MFFKKATKNYKIFTFDLTLTKEMSNQFFVDFLENMNIKEDSLNISYGLTELLSSFCSNTDNSASWEKLDCAGSCVKYVE